MMDFTDDIDETNGEKLVKGLAKNGAGFIASLGLFKLGSAIKRERKGSAQDILNMQQDIETSSAPTKWEFVFNEKFVVDGIKTMTDLLEATVLSGAIVETEVIETAKKLIDSMKLSLKLKEDKQNGNQA